jgi:hypothetical protein
MPSILLFALLDASRRTGSHPPSLVALFNKPGLADDRPIAYIHLLDSTFRPTSSLRPAIVPHPSNSNPQIDLAPLVQFSDLDRQSTNPHFIFFASPPPSSASIPVIDPKSKPLLIHLCTPPLPHHQCSPRLSLSPRFPASTVSHSTSFHSLDSFHHSASFHSMGRGGYGYGGYGASDG